jgi:uncharacterized repeat protein (TIGR02059 family)
MILSTSISADTRQNKMRNDFFLSLWWSGVLSSYGNIKGNRYIAKSIWTPDAIVNPTVSTATVEDNAKSNLPITFNHTLNVSYVPDVSAFAVLVNGSARGVNSLTVSGAVVNLTLASACAYGDTITVSYTKPASNYLRDNTTGGSVASFSGQTVTNNIMIPVNVPTGLTLSLISGGVRISWTDTNSGTAQTEIWGQNDGAAYSLLYTIDAGTVTKDDAGINPVDLRYYKIRAKIGSSYSSYTTPQSIAMLGSELINQSTWNTAAYWNYGFTGLWTQGTGVLTMNGGAQGNAIRGVIVTAGNKYRCITSYSNVVGSGLVPLYSGIGALPAQLTGTGSFYYYHVWDATVNVRMVGYAGTTGNVTGVSIKEILNP